MAEHVVQHAASLTHAVPEPGHVGSAVLLRCPGKVWTPGDRHGPPPDDLLPAHDGRLKHLILEIPVQHRHRLDQLDHAPRLAQVTGQRLFASDAG